MPVVAFGEATRGEAFLYTRDTTVTTPHSLALVAGRLVVREPQPLAAEGDMEGVEGEAAQQEEEQVRERERDEGLRVVARYRPVAPGRLTLALRELPAIPPKNVTESPGASSETDGETTRGTPAVDNSICLCTARGVSCWV